MTRLPFWALMGGVILFTAACDKVSESQFALDKSFQLVYGTTAECSCEAISISFLDVIEDSRCPSDVVCVWEGRVVVELKVETNGVTELLRLSSIHNESQASAGNFLISLRGVSPYPVTTATIPLHEYTVELVVSEL